MIISLELFPKLNLAVDLSVMCYDAVHHHFVMCCLFFFNVCAVTTMVTNVEGERVKFIGPINVIIRNDNTSLYTYSSKFIDY